MLEKVDFPLTNGQISEFIFGKVVNFLTIKENLTVSFFVESEHCTANCCFTATRFAYDADGGVFGDVKRNAVDCLYNTLLGEEIGVKIVDLQNIIGVGHMTEIFALVCLAVFISLERFYNTLVFLRNSADLFTREVVGIFLFCHNDSSLPL